MPRSYWWHGRDLEKFIARLLEIGLDNARAEFHPNPRAPEKSMLYARDTRDGADLSLSEHDGYNHAHPCPPDCD